MFTEEIGGASPGSGHDMHIESVDDVLTNKFFTRPGDALQA